MTQCKYCREYLWNEHMIAKNSCSGGLCSAAYGAAHEDNIILEDNPYFEEREDE